MSEVVLDNSEKDADQRSPVVEELDAVREEVGGSERPVLPVIGVGARDLAEFELSADSLLAGSGWFARTAGPFIVGVGWMRADASLPAAQWSCVAWVDVCWCCDGALLCVDDGPATSLSADGDCCWLLVARVPCDAIGAERLGGGICDMVNTILLCV